LQHGKATKQPTKPLLRWDIYKAAGKARLIGTVEAADVDKAVRKAAVEFKHRQRSSSRCGTDDTPRG